MVELFAQTISNLKANRLRSILTMFGIIWGIVSIIIMTSIGRGMHVAQMNKAKALGQDLMIVWGGLTTLQTEGFQAGRRVTILWSGGRISIGSPPRASITYRLGGPSVSAL